MSALVARAEERVVQVGERAALRALGKIRAQPHLLRRADVHRDVAVQRHDVPVAEVVAVIALAGRASGRAEVIEIAARVRRDIVVIAGHRLGAGLEPAPGRVVAVLVVGARAVRIGVVAHGHHGARNGVHQVRSEGIPVLGTVGDISGADQHAGRDDVHGHRVRTRPAAAVRHRDAHAVQAQRRVGMGGADRRRLARGAAGARGAVAPADRVCPWGIVRVGVGEVDRELNRVLRIGGDVGAGAHHGRGAVAAPGARVGERFARDRHELPGVAAIVERELQDTGGAAVPHLAIGPDGAKPPGFGAPRPHDELPDALRRVGDAGRRLGREPLVEGVVRVHHHIHAGGVQHVPQRADVRVGVVLGVEQRVVPVSERAARRVSGQIGAQPLHLR